MWEILDIGLNRLDVLMLLFIRVSGLLFVSTVFGRQNVPGTLKIGLSFFLSYLLMIAYPPEAVEYNNMWGYASMAVRELVFGIILGYATTVFFSATFVAGQIIDMQSGFSMVNVLDPNSNTQVPITGNMLNIIMTMCFIAMNGHRRLVWIMAGTLERVPVGMVHIDAQMATTVIQMFIYAFVLGISIAMPSIAAGVCTEVALGVMIRTVPQMNMYVVGIPIKIIIGFVIIGLMIPVFIGLTGGIFDQLYTYIDALIERLVPI